MSSDLLQRIEGLLRRVQQVRAVNVNSAALKEEAIVLAKFYFSDARPLLKSIATAELLTAYDEDWQDLVRLAQGNNSKRSYAKILKTLREKEAEFAVQAIRYPPDGELKLSTVEQQLLTTLQSLIPSAAASYRQAIEDLRSPALRFSYRGTSCEFRDALRETLDHLAPDDAVLSQEGFTLEPNQTKPTMRQKVRFVMKSRELGDTARATTEKAVNSIESTVGELTRAVYNLGSLATHTSASRNEVSRLKRYVETVLMDLLELDG